MGSPCVVPMERQPAERTASVSDGFGDLILERMRERRISLRQLSVRCGMGKSRLGLLLHGDLGRRLTPSLTELLAILEALDLSIFEAIIRVDAIKLTKMEAHRHSNTIIMLARLFKTLPARLIAALEELDDFSAGDVRPEWAIGLERALVKRVTQEIAAVAARRAVNDFSF